MTVLYVSATGSDAASGASASPFKTISKAAQMARPGDTVLVGAGTYAGVVSIASNGTASAPITFKPVDGAKVIIDGANTAANTSLVQISGDYVVFQGFEVKNAKRTGISLWDTHDTKVIGNTVHDSVRAGIWAGTDTIGSSYNNVIEGNTVFHNVKENTARTASSGWAQAIGAYGSDNLVIRNNTSYDNWGEGIGIQSSLNAKITGNVAHDNFSVDIYLDNAQGAVVQGNTAYTTNDTAFYRNGKPAWGIRVANEYVDRPLPSKDIVITGNVLAGSGEIGYGHYEADTGLVNATIENNTFYTSYTQIPNLGEPAPAPTPVPAPTPAPVPEPVPVPDTGLPVTTKTISGSDSNNYLTGSSGNDLMKGNGGRDVLWGKAGSDVLHGGTGQDAFVFDTAIGKDVDWVMDFNVVDDTIRLENAVFTRLATGALSSGAFVIGDKALDSSDRILYNPTTGALAYDADGSGAGAAVKFAQIDNHARLTAADFIVI